MIARQAGADIGLDRLADQRRERQTVLDGAMNGRAFLAYVRQELAPTLSRGDMVMSS